MTNTASAFLMGFPSAAPGGLRAGRARRSIGAGGRRSVFRPPQPGHDQSPGAAAGRGQGQEGRVMIDDAECAALEAALAAEPANLELAWRYWRSLAAYRGCDV